MMMTAASPPASTRQSGFTLVELAITLMIIGLLVGAVIKGTEMVENARVVRTIDQVQKYKIAVISFRDMYGAWPGDIRDPDVRLADCTVANNCGVAGDSNNRVGTRMFAVSTTALFNNDNDTENRRFFLHLAKTNLISGVDINGGTGTNWGDMYPAAPFGGFQIVNLNIPTPSMGNQTGVNDVNMLLLRKINTVGTGMITVDADPGTPQQALRPLLAQRMDAKLDDGMPHSGSVRGVTRNFPSPTECYDGWTDGVYNVNAPNDTCNLMFGLD